MLKLTCMAVLAAGVAAASAESPARGDIPVSNEPWPVLPDGRLAFDIFARRIALLPCDTCRRGIRFLIVREEDPTFVDLKFGEVIQDPARLRRALVRADKVRVVSGNLPDMQGLLFGRFERRAMPISQMLTLAIYREPLRYKDCARDGGPLAALPCELLLRLASEPERADSAGFVVQHGHFPGGTGKDTLYVSTTGTLRSAVGLPSFFICNWAAVCQNALNAIEGPGFLIAPDLGVAFSFNREAYPEAEWISLQRQVQAMFEGMIIQ